jgi:hypothetical protein
MISKKTVNKKVNKDKMTAISWTFYVLQAVELAKKENKPVTLHVALPNSASLLQEALMGLALNGEDAAWNVDVKLHKHIH